MNNIVLGVPNNDFQEQRDLPMENNTINNNFAEMGKSRAEYMRDYRRKKREEKLKSGNLKKIARSSTQRSRDFRARAAAKLIQTSTTDVCNVAHPQVKNMSLQNNSHVDVGNTTEEILNKTVIKQEHSLVSESIHIKSEVDYNEDHTTIESPIENIRSQIKQEYVQPDIEKQVIYQTCENYEMPTVQEDNDMPRHSFLKQIEICKHKVREETVTNIYDDNIEIKEENEMIVEHDPYECSNAEDSRSMDSNEAKALHNVEACLQDEIKIKSESELFEENQNHDVEKVTIKNEIELTVTDTHLISNKIINTPSTITNLQDSIIKSQTTKTLIMEILPMDAYPGTIPLGKIGNPEEILPTSYANNECSAMDYDDTFQLNSITGDVMSLEQEAYGLLEAKNKEEKLERPYVCSKCPKAYRAPYLLKKHESVHDTIEKRALGISKGLKTKEANKMKKINEEKKFAQRMTEKLEIETVKLVPDNVKKEGYECTCGKFFRRRSRMETCSRSHNICPISFLGCPSCTRQFKYKEELALHRRRMHRKLRFSCKFCPTDYKSRKELFKHLQIHQKVQVMEYKVLSEIVNGKQQLKCFMCSKTYTELSELKTHVMNDHKEPYVCPHCNDTFTKIIDFGNHTKTNHPEVEGQSVLDVLEAFSKLVKAWKCEECEVQFHEADKLALHKIEKHSLDLKVEPQFQCLDCRRVFISHKGLTSHRRIHHNTESMDDSEMLERGILCIECRKICRDTSALSAHMRLHSSERKYPCKFCDFRFATPEKRKIHAELHTGDMKYVCFICEYQCSSENRLKQHKMSAKHLSMKDFLKTGKPLAVQGQSTSKTAENNDGPEKEEWVVVKGEDAEEDSDDDSSSNTGDEITCDICGQTFNTVSKMLKHKTTHPFIEIPNEDKPTRIFFK